MPQSRSAAAMASISSSPRLKLSFYAPNPSFLLLYHTPPDGSTAQRKGSWGPSPGRKKFFINFSQKLLTSAFVYCTIQTERRGESNGLGTDRPRDFSISTPRSKEQKETKSTQTVKAETTPFPRVSRKFQAFIQTARRTREDTAAKLAG